MCRYIIHITATPYTKIQIEYFYFFIWFERRICWYCFQKRKKIQTRSWVINKQIIRVLSFCPLILLNKSLKFILEPFLRQVSQKQKQKKTLSNVKSEFKICSLQNFWKLLWQNVHFKPPINVRIMNNSSLKIMCVSFSRVVLT